MKPRSLIVFLSLVSAGQWAMAATNAPAALQSQTEKAQAAADNTGAFHPGEGTVIVAELTRMLEAKKLKAGDPVDCRVTQDLLYQGKIIIPRDARAVGHVTEASGSSKEHRESRLGLLFEKIVLKDKRELPFQFPAIVVAVGAPVRRGVMPTTRPDEMPIQTQKGMSSGGALVTALDNNASLAGANMPSPRTGVIGASNRGVIGIKDLVLVRAEAKGNEIVSVKGDVRLEYLTQVVLRVVDLDHPK